MNSGDREALHDLRGIFKQYASLDVDFGPSGTAPEEWAVCAKVECDSSKNCFVAIMAGSDMAMAAADNILGFSSTPTQQIDAIKEMANVLSGHAYALFKAGQRPQHIGVPQLLHPSEAMALWEAAPADSRYVLKDGDRIVGGAVVALSGVWTSQWV